MIRPLLHLIDTNAPGKDGGVGFRVAESPAGWPLPEQERLAFHLRKQRPTEMAPAPWRVLVMPWRVGGSNYCCLGLLDRRAGEDEHGREGGAFFHALLTEVREGDQGLHALALARVAKGLQPPRGPIEGRLPLYLEACRKLTQVEIPELAPDKLIKVQEVLLRRLLRASCAARPEAPVQLTFLASRDQTLPEAVAEACAALPPRLRFGLHWGCWLEPSDEVMVTFHPPRAGESPFEPPRNRADTYLDWLNDRLVRGETRDLRRVLENWEIRSWDQLLDEIEDGPTVAVSSPDLLAWSAPELPVASLPDAPAIPPSQGSRKALSTPADAAALDRQQRALEEILSSVADRHAEVLRAHVDQQMKTLQERLEQKTRQGGGNARFTQPKKRQGRAVVAGQENSIRNSQEADAGEQPDDAAGWKEVFLRWRPEIYAGALLVLWLSVFIRLPGSRAGDQPPPGGSPTGEEVNTSEPMGTDISPPEISSPEVEDSERLFSPLSDRESGVTVAALASTDWGTVEWSAREPWVKALGRKDGLSEEQVPLEIANEFAEFREGHNFRTKELRGLFEYTAALWAATTRNDRTVKITAVPYSVEPVIPDQDIRDFLRDLKITDAPLKDGKIDQSDKGLQSAIVRRWMATQRLPPSGPAGEGAGAP